MLNRLLLSSIFILTAFVLSACGGGSSSPTTSTPAAATTYTIGGTVTGLTSGSLVLQNNGGDALTDLPP